MSVARDENGVPIPGEFSLVAQKIVTFDTTLVDAQAAHETAMTGDNNDIVFTAQADWWGEAGNEIAVEFIDPGIIDASLVVTVRYELENGLANPYKPIITVSLATDGSGVITSTADLIKTAIAAHAEANSIVATADAAANDGSGVVEAFSATYLEGGVGFPLFRVTGLNKVCIVGLGVETPTIETGATISVGVHNDPDAFLPVTAADSIAPNEIWHDATVDNRIEATTILAHELLSGRDIIMSIATEAVNTGSVKILCFYTPLSPGASVVPV